MHANVSTISNSNALTAELASASSGCLVKTQLPGATLRASDTVGLGAGDQEFEFEF